MVNKICLSRLKKRKADIDKYKDNTPPVNE